MSTISEHAKSFKANKDALSPKLKLETNIPTKILKVLSFESNTQTSESTGKDYASFEMMVEVETALGVVKKLLSTGSESLVASLEDKGIDVGSSFTITKKGEGFHTKYEISDVKNA